MISVIIPTYNRAKVIPAALNSIVVQSYQDWECIVVDDYSEDDTESVVNSYVAKDNRFSYCKNERTKGAPGARNTGLYQAKGEWLTKNDTLKEEYDVGQNKRKRCHRPVAGSD